MRHKGNSFNSPSLNLTLEKKFQFSKEEKGYTMFKNPKFCFHSKSMTDFIIFFQIRTNSSRWSVDYSWDNNPDIITLW